MLAGLEIKQAFDAKTRIFNGVRQRPTTKYIDNISDMNDCMGVQASRNAEAGIRRFRRLEGDTI
jgi:hypothetical protein